MLWLPASLIINRVGVLSRHTYCKHTRALILTFSVSLTQSKSICNPLEERMQLPTGRLLTAPVPCAASQGEARRAQASAARLIDDVGWSSPPAWPGLAASVGFASAAAAPPASPVTSPASQQRLTSASGSLGPRAGEQGAPGASSSVWQDVSEGGPGLGRHWQWVPGEGASEWGDPSLWSSAACQRLSGARTRLPCGSQQNCTLCAHAPLVGCLCP